MNTILVCHSFLPDGTLAAWREAFPACRFVEARDVDAQRRLGGDATVAFGLPDLKALPALTNLRWIQLASAGVPWELCPLAQAQGIQVTNLAGLYGPTIAEHAVAMMLILSRNLHVVQRNQARAAWDRSVATTMRDLRGRTLGIVGLGNIGQNVARLGQAFGMRTIGTRRTARPTPFVDEVLERTALTALASASDVVVVAAPLTRETDGLLGDAFFAALKPGAIYVNVSRGPIAQEAALVRALDAGQVSAAGLDVFAVEPLAAGHTLWSRPNVLVSPHYSGETVNLYAAPSERFARNLRNWLAQTDLEGAVDLVRGY